VEELLRRLEKGETYIKEGIYEAFMHEQPKRGEAWRFIPPLIFRQNPLLSLQYSYSLYSNRFALLGSIAEIGNGMVTGLDEAFQLRSLDELNEEEKTHIIYIYKANTLDRFFPIKKPVPYIYINDVWNEEEFRLKYPHFYEQLRSFKAKLLNRYNYGKDILWWHWVFPRNKHLFERYKEKIFVPSKERYDTRGYFRFAYIKGLYYATQDVTAICPNQTFREGVLYLLALLNSKVYQEYIEHRGFTRGGVYDFSERPLASIPIPRIDWNNNDERRLHEEIINIAGDIIIKGLKEAFIEEINNIVLKLINYIKFSNK
jgi:adenine-specific DNA-methyltransferase